MKKLTLLFTALLLGITSIIAQAPSQFKYQAVLRDAGGEILSSENVTVDIAILQGNASGTSVFDESHNVTTTAQGLINLNIGSVSDLSTVDFSADTYFIEITVDGTTMGTSQLLSVPYALQAKTAENVFTGDYNDLTNTPTLFDGTWTSLTGKPTLANVATSGNYSDLSNKPGNATTSTDGFMSSADKTKLDGIAAGAEVNVNADWNAASGDAQILNKPTLADVATSGSYNDLNDKPAITDDQTLAEVLSESNDGGTSQIKNIADPTDNQDAATKAYIDNKFDMLSIANNGVTDIDGNYYEAVLIGNQIWMAEDLRVTTYPNGTAIPNVTDNTVWSDLADDNTGDAYCFYNNDNTTDYGALYTYAAAIGDNWVNDNAANQGVCPDGWHLPTDAEWTELTDYLGGTSVAGGKMKETGTTHWTGPNTGATNESGFLALPGGHRDDSNGASDSAGNAGFWWSATESSSTDAGRRGLFNDNAEVYPFWENKSNGFSVRCVRD